MKAELERIEIPGEHGARERAWAVVETAFAEREPVERRRSWKPVVVLAVGLAVVAGLLSPPGRAVLDEIREVVGVEEAQPGLFSLPAGGRLLVTSDAGAWVVDRDGSKRLLGAYREASWSPFGRYVVATRRNELVALEPDGDVRWSLARPAVSSPRWGGTRTDTRVAYLSRRELRVIGGDGKGDHLIDRPVAAKAPAWQPGPGHRLAYERVDGTIVIVDADTGVLLDRDAPNALEQQATARVVRRTIGAGRIGSSALSPDRRWVLVAWPEADQLVFFRTRGGQQIRAVSNVSAQFRSRSFPTIQGWCCAG